MRVKNRKEDYLDFDHGHDIFIKPMVRTNESSQMLEGKQIVSRDYKKSIVRALQYLIVLIFFLKSSLVKLVEHSREMIIK